MRSVLKITAGILSVLYPLIIYGGMRLSNASPRIVIVLILAVGLVYFLAYTDDIKGKGFQSMRFWGMAICVTVLALLMHITENAEYAKFYPVFINAFMLVSFLSTLVKPPTMIFRFAVLQDKKLMDSPDRSRIEKYCRTVTTVWVTFFLINGSIAFFSVFWANGELWALYNGLLSYLCMGVIFLAEWIIRKRITGS